MTKRSSVTPAPGPLEGYALLVSTTCSGLVVPSEKALDATWGRTFAPYRAQQDPHRPRQYRAPRRSAAQGGPRPPKWFLSESSWDAEAINERRIELLLEDPRTAPNEKGALGSSTRPATARTPRRPLMWG
jgi:hypothetical protein